MTTLYEDRQLIGWCVSCSTGNHGHCKGTMCSCPSGACGGVYTLDHDAAEDAVPQTDAFGSAVRSAIGGTLDVEQERASSYGDTWALAEFETSPLLDHVAGRYGISLTPRLRRLLTAACHADQKERRLRLGKWNPDHVIDAANYRAAFLTWWEERA